MLKKFFAQTQNILENDSKEHGKLIKFLSISIGVILLLVLVISIFKNIGHDELEHVHCTWYIENGFRH